MELGQMLGVFGDPEILEVHRIAKERGVSVDDLLKEKMAPSQERISGLKGQPIGALARSYEFSRGIIDKPFLTETFYAGIITPDTRFSYKFDTDNLPAFLVGVKNAHSMSLGFPFEEREFSVKEDSFGSFDPVTTPFLYFMDRPPVMPKEPSVIGCYGPERPDISFPTDKPRLELHLGNTEAIPFFQQHLAGWQYLHLSELLEYNLPMTEELMKRIEQEQLKVYDLFRNAEAKLIALEERKQKAMEAMNREVDPVDDEVSVCLRHNPGIRDARSETTSALRRAIKRRYHETEAVVERTESPGVVMRIDMQEFFSKKKEMYGL